MDWWKALDPNLQSALIGGLLATLPLLLGLIVQIFVHISGNREKRKEAKIRSSEKWIASDVIKAMAFVERIIILLDEVDNLQETVDRLANGKKAGIIPKKEFEEIRKELYISQPKIFSKVWALSRRLLKLIYSFEDKILATAYEDFSESIAQVVLRNTELLNKSTEGEAINDDELNLAWRVFNRDAGILHKHLRNKLLALRQ